MEVESLHSKGLFPFSPKALLKAIEAVEFCYDEKEEDSGGLTMFDEDYVNYVKRKEEQKEKQKEEERQQRESRKSNRPKKMNINSLFLQDIKAKEEREARRSERSKKRKQVLAKRAKKKSKQRFSRYFCRNKSKYKIS